MLLEFLDVFFNFKRFGGDYSNNEPQDIQDTVKKNALKRYNAEKEIEKETDPERKAKMQYLFNSGVTDFSDI